MPAHVGYAPELGNRLSERLILSLKHWEEYYRAGALATCPTTPAGGFDQELLSVWADFLAPLPDGAVILDIGTGNGVVLLLAVELAERSQRHWELHGSDLAQIDPPRDVPAAADRLALCRFHPGVATEQLPFDDASFDAITGHYALEYAEPTAAFAELTRVLRPAGRAQFILHHADSRLVETATRALAEAEIVLAQSRIYRHLKRLLALPDQSATLDSRETRALRAAIHDLKDAYADASSRGGGRVLAVTLDAVRQLLECRPQLGPARALAEAERAENDLRLSVRRLKDLPDRACDETAMQGLVDLALANGLGLVAVEPQFHAGDNLVGWRLELRRG